MEKSENTQNRFWKYIRSLIEPPPNIGDIRQRHQARLLSALLLFIIVLGGFSGTIQLLTVPGFFPTFIPTNDICVSSGTSRLWALFYKTGSAYQEPIIGTTTSGANQTVNKFGSLGEGLAFGIVVHMGSGRDGGSPFGLLINMSQGNFGDCATCGGNGGSPNSGINVPVAIDPRSHFFSWTNM